MNNEILDEQFGVVLTPAVFENERHKIVFDRTKNYLELIKKEEVLMTMEENEDINSRAIPTETRYVTYYEYCEEDELLDNFDLLWANSWLPQETLLKDDYEVTVNRIHNEVVLVRRLHKAIPMNLEEESVQEPQYEYDYRYLPIYEVTASDVMDRFEDFWSLEPLMTLDEPVVASEVDYEIAGQVLEDRLDLGEGYENLAITSTKGSGVDYKITHLENGHIRYDFNGIVTDKGLIWLATYHSVNAGESTTYSFECLECSEELLGIDVGLRNSPTSSNKLKIGEIVGIGASSSFPRLLYTPSVGLDLTGKYFIIKNLQITKTSELKPFIKNSRPDSKLALPQLAELGELKSTEMIDTTLVAKHEQGTVIIKDAKVDANMPDESIQAMLLPTSDNRLMFKSDPRNPVKLKTYMDKTLDECIVEETGDYVLYNDNPDGQPTFACRYDKNTKEIYVGDGYENYSVGRNIWTWIDDGVGSGDNIKYTVDKSKGIRFTKTAINVFNGLSLNEGDRFLITFNSSIPLTGVEQLKPEEFVIDNFEVVDGLYKVFVTKGSGNYAFIDLLHTSYNGVFDITNIKATKVLKDKPFVSSYCPTGRIELDKLENIAIKEPVEKDTSNDPLSSLEFGLEAYRNDGKWRLYCATREKYPVGWENIKYDDDPSGASIFYDVSKTSTANNISGMITVDGEVYIGEGYENIAKNKKIYGSAINYDFLLTSSNNVEYSFKINDDNFTGSSHSAGYGYSPYLYFQDYVELGSDIVFDFEVIDIKNGNSNTRLDINRGEAKIGKGQKISFTRKNISSESNVVFTIINANRGCEVLFRFSITKTSTPKPFTTGIVPNGSLKIECDWSSENKSFIVKSLKNYQRIVTGDYVNIKTLIRIGTSIQGFPNGARYDLNVNNIENFNDLLLGSDVVINNSKALTITHSKKQYSLRNTSNVGNGGTGIGGLDGGKALIFMDTSTFKAHTPSSFKQILIYNNPNLTQSQLEGELAKDIKLHTYKFPINRVNHKFLAGLQPVKNDNGYNKLYFRSEDGQYPLGWDNMTYWEEETGVFTDLPNPNL